MQLFEYLFRRLLALIRYLFPRPRCTQGSCATSCKGFQDADFFRELEIRSENDVCGQQGESSYGAWILGRGLLNPGGYDVPCQVCGCGRSRHGMQLEVWTPDRLPNGGAVLSELNRRKRATTLAQRFGTVPSTNPRVEAFESTDLVVGQGNEAARGKTLKVNYVGKIYQTGKVFETAKGVAITLGQWTLIPGWDDGLPGMKAGGKRRLLIPSYMAYGPVGINGVRDADLDFEVELLSVTENKQSSCVLQ